MRRRSVFWPLVLIVVGGVLLLDNLGLFAALDISVWGLIWPLVLILLGVQLLFRVGRGRPTLQVKEAAIPLGGATRALVHIHHGAGRLQVAGGAPAGALAAGTFRGGLDFRTRQQGDLLEVEMRVPAGNAPFLTPFEWGPGGALDWEVALTDVPLVLDLETGANDTQLDLHDLQVGELRLKTGASNTVVQLPARAGHTLVRLEAGAASIKLNVPGGVAARIRSSGALAATNVDTTRFERVAGGYESPGYDQAENRVEVDISAAMGTVDVR